ncbi:MAG: ABC transporter permease [Deltaproteobacteria bacterium]|nr:ABC transporter permease [Deltaproteobacteria bacterium]
MVPVRYNIRSLLVRKVTTFATAIGIALVVFVFAAAQMLGEGVNRALANSGRTDTVIVLRKGSDAELSSTLDGERLNMLRSNSAVASSAPGGGVIGESVLVITAELADGSGGISNVLLRGMPADGMKFRPEARIVSGRAPSPGTNEVIVGKSISGRFEGIAPGKTFEVRRNRPLLVVGEFETGGTSYQSEVWGDLDTIRASVGRESVVSSARVRLTSASAFEGYRAAMEADKRLNLKVMREDDYFKKASEQTSGFLAGMGMVIAILFSIAAMIGAAITMNGAVANRTREIGTLRALGFSRLAILTSFMLEAIFLSLIGAAIGLLFVQLLALVSFPTMNFQTFSEIVIRFAATPAIMISSTIFAVAMGLLGGLAPAIRAARISPVEAMRG